MSPKHDRIEVAHTGSGLVVPRGNTATHSWHSTWRRAADESMQIEVYDHNYGFGHKRAL